MTEMVVKRKVAELKPQVDNPREVTPRALAALADSIKNPDFGFEEGGTCAFQPVIVNKHPDFLDQLVGGEMRWRATQAAGIEWIWTREVELDADQQRELTVRLNVPAGEWDWDRLAQNTGEEQLLLMGLEEFKTRELRPYMVPIDEPVLDESNAREHNARSVSTIAAMLKKFGQRKPIVLQRGSNIVTAGNGTLLAARELGWKEIAVVYAALSDEDRQAYALGDNRAAEVSSWDLEQLSRQLREIEDAAAASVASGKEGATKASDLGWQDHEAQPLLRADWAPPVIKPLEVHAPSTHLKLDLSDEQRVPVDDAITLARNRWGAELAEEDAVKMICQEWAVGERAELEEAAQ